MAVVVAVKFKAQSKTAMAKVIAYVSQDKKTLFDDFETGQKYRLISGYNCVAETAIKEFMATKAEHGKANGVFYRHFVQSFKPGETVNPDEIHRMGLELAEYFKGFEVVCATHIDNDHWHNHLIINSVSLETGLKIQFNEKNLTELRNLSDIICRAHGLDTLKKYRKDSTAKGISTREYRSAERGESWKFKLINAIDIAMVQGGTKSDFITNMGRMGYGVKWESNHKYITYTTPEGKKCRDIRLHEEKYLKESMEEFYELGEVERTKQTGHSGNENGANLKTDECDSSVLCNPNGNIRCTGTGNDGNRQTPDPDTRAYKRDSDLGDVDGEPETGNRTGNGRTHESGGKVREKPDISLREPKQSISERLVTIAERQAKQLGTDPQGTGQPADKIESQVGGNRRIDTDSILGALVDIEHLLDLSNRRREKEDRKREAVNQNRQRKRQTRDRDYDQGMGL